MDLAEMSEAMEAMASQEKLLSERNKGDIESRNFHSGRQTAFEQIASILRANLENQTESDSLL